ncbi:MAG: ABC transporter [Treponema sp.]|nr:ABC transporter [Treponema sp.]
MENKNNNIFKRFWSWIKSSDSDFVLFVVFLVLLNLVGSHAFFRLDLTSARSYSLSKASVQVVKNLEEPLSVKVFFTKKLPSPYNSVEQYVHDLLVEYSGKANDNFSYEFFDMDKPENQNMARDYNLRQIQIQEVKDNEVGFKNAYMGIVLTYSDRIELLDGLQSAEGLEYKITTTMSKMIATTNTLAGLSSKVKMTLYASSKLKAFNINGFDYLDKVVNEAYNTVNRKNRDRISYEKVDPSSEQIAEIVSKYGMQKITWKDKNSQSGMDEGVIGMVLEYGDNFRIVPLQLVRGFFGNFGISGLDNLEESITESLQSLVSKSSVVGYVVGHGEKDLSDKNSGSAPLASIVSDTYEFYSLDLSDEDIPANITSIVINGPKQSFSDLELYKIDQFLMKGGNLILFIDPFEEITMQGQMSYYQQPQYVPIDTGLEKLLTKHGVKLGKNYVLDKNCYETMDQRLGKVALYFAPILQKDGLNKKHPITKNLGFVIMVNPGSIDVEIPENAKHTATILANSSAESWLMANNIVLNPMMMSVPAKETMKKENLAVLLEGNFDSAFENPVITEVLDEEKVASAEEKKSAKMAGEVAMAAENHIKSSVQKGKIFVTTTSSITTSQVIDESGRQPIALFIRNAIDYMNGNEDLCAMRTKGLALDTLKKVSKPAISTAKAFNQYGLPILVALGGFIVWRSRVSRRKRIRNRYNANDSRQIK